MRRVFGVSGGTEDLQFHSLAQRYVDVGMEIIVALKREGDRVYIEYE